MPGICDGKLTLFKSGALPALGRFATAAWSPICDASYLKWAASESMNLQKSNRRTPGWSLRHPQVIAPRSPWQNPYVERLIGSIRRECLDHMIVWNEKSLCRILHSYFHYYEGSRTHLALAKDAPVPRAVDQPENGRIEAISQVGGLHHRYQRRAA